MLGYRVLDLSDERGQLAGQVLADLGADVILVEPPGGSSSRAVGPFASGDDGDPERSLWFWSYNRAKRSVVIDITQPDGRDQLLALAATADAIITSAEPGYMESLGLGYADLASANGHLVYTAITPFGSDGPKSEWRATDLIVSAASMLTNVMGDEDRPPLRIPLDQTFLHASAEAAAATLIALHERKRSGRGQLVDVSAQQAVTLATQSTSLCHLYNSPESTRLSGGAKLGPFRIRLRSPAADGYVSVTVLFGEAIGPFGERLFNYMHSLGGCEDSDLEIDWVNFVEGVMTGRIELGEYERIQDVVAAFTAQHTKADLLEAALEHRLLMVPITTVEDVVADPHFAARSFWRDIDVGDTQGARFPGPIAGFSQTPIDMSAPPPRLGEHTDEVLTELANADSLNGAPATNGPTSNGPAASAPVVSQSESASSDASPDANAAPLADVKVLDFMWVMAGPASTRVLADWGATVVRVESSSRVETARTLQPFINDEGGADNSGLFQNMNANKLGITINLANPAARDLVFDLVRWADVVCESFSPKAMRQWGYSYDDLRKIKPDIIMASSCLFGQSGPLSELAGFGSMGAAMSGFYEMTGWPDRDPAGVFGAYTDYVSPKFLSAAILSALEHRERTGEGQHIDLSQAEASMLFLAPAVLDFTVNGNLPPKLGNDHPVMSPHGVFEAAGDDRWIALACQDDQQWRALCGVIGADDLAEVPLAERRQRADEIAQRITKFTSATDGETAQQILQDAGVAAHAVASSQGLANDVQLEHRKHFRLLPHAVNSEMWVEGPRFSMSRSPDAVVAAAPTYGQHTFDVLERLLGYSADQVGELAVAGVLE